MSRSYKKQPFYHGGGWISKTCANKLLRARLKSSDPDMSLPKGKQYRKYVETYEINDFISYWPLDQAVADWMRFDRFQGRYSSEHDFITHCWAKNHNRK